LSIGVQSFDDAMLPRSAGCTTCPGHRRAEEAREAFDTFNLDLMYALPGQDAGASSRRPAHCAGLQPTHLSVYHLTIEPNTRFANAPPAGLPDDDLAGDMLDQITARRRGRPAALRGVGLRPARPPLPPQPELLAVRRLPRHRRRGAQQAELSAPRRAPGALARADRLHGKSAGRPGACRTTTRWPRKTLPFEFMLNALRLKEGFDLSLFPERTGLPMSAVRSTLDEAQQRGLITQTGPQVVPTARGFDFLSDLQALFLPAKPRS
jgi:coproporphyrinogen III oxidase-like Fe-S oxidoreductase